MELPFRERGDQLLKPGEFTALRDRLRRITPRHDLAAVIACAFDHRTRMLPFVYADMRMAPAGVRAVASALLDVGVEKTRVVLQQWNRRFRPSEMRLDGRIPDLFLVSSMQLHSAACKELIRDACRIDAAHRPLIIAGGPKVIYEPWDVFSFDSDPAASADVAVTGEEFVLLELLETLLDFRAPAESLRGAFLRARLARALDPIPGLVFPRGDSGCGSAELVDTGIQRLLSDLDELPSPVLGYRVLEPPGRRTHLASRPLEPRLVRKYSPIGSLVLTFGCKFACTYCPIPAYNQRQFRAKSGQRIADEMDSLVREFGIRFFFGADDNFFNHEERTLEIVDAVARRRKESGRGYRFRWATEVTVHDTLKLREHLPLVRNAGVRALWMGVEDMTATLVKKGQSVDRTVEAFRLLRNVGINPMPMMMHHDQQPLLSRGPKPYGLLNQIRILRKAGAVSMQVLMLVPATGSKLFVGTYTSGMVYQSVGGRAVEEHMLGGNYVIASHHPRPWVKQANILIAYAYFYNPVRFVVALVRPKSRLWLADAGCQVLGMWGLLQTLRRTIGWAGRLFLGRIERRDAPPMNHIPLRAVDGSAAAHALPGARVVSLTRPALPVSVDSPPQPPRSVLPVVAAR